MNLKLKKIAIALSAISVLSMAAAPAQADGEFAMGFGVLGAAVGVPIAAVFIPWGAWEYFHPAKVDPSLAFSPMAASDVSIEHQQQLASLLTGYAKKHCTDTGGSPMRWAILTERDYNYSLERAQAAVSENNQTITMTNMPGNERPIEDDFSVHAHMQAVEAGKAHVGLSCVRDDAVGGGQVTIHHGYDPVEVWAEKSDGMVHIRTQDTRFNAPRFSKTAIVGWDVIEKAAARDDKQNQKINF